MLGTAGLPHVLMRFYTVPTAKDARRSVVWAIWLIGIFYLFSLVIGYGAGALVGADEILAAPGAVNAAAPLLAFELGGTALLGIISGVAFATILAVVAGLTITASASFAHDVYANVIKKGQVPPNGEVRVARITAVVIGAIAIGLGILALQAGLNIAFLVALAFAVAASANLPTILYTLFWKNFTTQGALWSIYGGLIACVGLIIFSPVVSGAPVDPATGKSTSLFQDVDFHWFPLNNPGLVSIPLSFFLGWPAPAVQGAPGRAQERRARGARVHRHRRGEGRPALKDPATRRSQARVGTLHGGRPEGPLPRRIPVIPGCASACPTAGAAVIGCRRVDRAASSCSAPPATPAPAPRRRWPPAAPAPCSPAATPPAWPRWPTRLGGLETARADVTDPALGARAARPRRRAGHHRRPVPAARSGGGRRGHRRRRGLPRLDRGAAVRPPALRGRRPPRRRAPAPRSSRRSGWTTCPATSPRRWPSTEAGERAHRVDVGYSPRRRLRPGLLPRHAGLAVGVLFEPGFAFTGGRLVPETAGRRVWRFEATAAPGAGCRSAARST